MEITLSRQNMIKVLSIAAIIAIVSIKVNAQESEESTSRQPAAPFEMRLNQGVPLTKDSDVEVELRPTSTGFGLVESMRVGLKADLSNATWVPLNPRTSVRIQGEDGKKTVYGQLKDKAGNLSSILSRSITYDTKPPTNAGIRLNDGNQLTNSRTGKIKLTLNAEDVFKMQISNLEYFDDAKWNSNCNLI